MELTREQTKYIRNHIFGGTTNFVTNQDIISLCDTVDALQSRLETATHDALRAAAEHGDFWMDGTGYWKCRCGVIVGDDSESSEEMYDSHRQHILNLVPTSIRLKAELRELEVRKVALNDATQKAIEERDVPECDGGNMLRSDACDNVRIWIRGLIQETDAAIAKLKLEIERGEGEK